MLPVVMCTPGQYPLQRVPSKYFDVQASATNLLPTDRLDCHCRLIEGVEGTPWRAFFPPLHGKSPSAGLLADDFNSLRALIDGATTLELDNGITKVRYLYPSLKDLILIVFQDGQVIVWHDEDIVAEKCQDTGPAFKDDPEFPYVGKFVANLTLAQLQTLDCGSKRQISFRVYLTRSFFFRSVSRLHLALQSVYPGVRIPTLKELFSFVECADPEYRMLWNIESKVNPVFPNRTRSPTDFVTMQHELFVDSPYYHSITVSLLAPPLSLPSYSNRLKLVSKLRLEDSRGYESLFLSPIDLSPCAKLV